MLKSLTCHSKFFPPTAEDLPETAPTTEPLPLDTQDSSLIAAAEKSANNEEPSTKKLKVTNSLVESEEWETVEKPEEFLETEDAAGKDISQSGVIVDAAVPEPVERKHAEEAKNAASAGGGLGENSLLKDW